MEILDQAFAAIESFHPLSNAEATRYLRKPPTPQPPAVTSRFKTTSIFDGAAQNPQWLGEQPPAVQQLMQA